MLQIFPIFADFVTHEKKPGYTILDLKYHNDTCDLDVSDKKVR